MRAGHLASRAGRWSAQHRKQAILGWIVFVVLATVAGGMVGTNELKDAEQGNGSSRSADLAVARRPASACRHQLTSFQVGAGPARGHFCLATSSACYQRW